MGSVQSSEIWDYSHKTRIDPEAILPGCLLERAVRRFGARAG